MSLPHKDTNRRTDSFFAASKSRKIIFITSFNSCLHDGSRSERFAARIVRGSLGKGASRMLPITMNGVLLRETTEISKNPSEGSEIDEARNLVQCCAEPRPVGDSVKAAINRAAKRLGFSYTRTMDIWYGNARRIDAREMDRLRSCASNIEIDQTVAGLKVLRARLSGISTPAARQALDGINAILVVLGGGDYVGVVPTSATDVGAL